METKVYRHNQSELYLEFTFKLTCIKPDQKKYSVTDFREHFCIPTYWKIFKIFVYSGHTVGCVPLITIKKNAKKKKLVNSKLCPRGITSGKYS